jgi:crotonobetainyl-CoA:carnitine CoA-transferase CaiB-like acyl-CoA transferase
VISVGDDTEWYGLRAMLGNPSWADDERFATPAGRHTNHDEIDEKISEWTPLRADARACARRSTARLMVAGH